MPQASILHGDKGYGEVGFDGTGFGTDVPVDDHLAL